MSTSQKEHTQTKTSANDKSDDRKNHDHRHEQNDNANNSDNSAKAQGAHGHTGQDQLSRHDHEDHSQRQEKDVLQHGRSTFVSDISQAITTKHNEVFLLTTRNGDILRGQGGLGLYYHDTRYLDCYEMRLNGRQATSLLATAEQGSTGVFELTNPDLPLADQKTLPKEQISIQRKQELKDGLTDTIQLHNLTQQAIDIELTVAFANSFTNMFVVRGAQPGKRGTIEPPHCSKNTLRFVYDGADHHRRVTNIHFTPAPDALDGETATWRLHIGARDRFRLAVKVSLSDTPPHSAHQPSAASMRHSREVAHKRLTQALTDLPEISSSNALFDRALQRSFADLHMLVMTNDDEVFVAAGVPWYVALFGRDSLIAAYETLAFQPELARTTLELLAHYQGTKSNDFQEEAPGKIMHELRLGEKANLHEVPQIPYYGTVDATPWFLLLLGEYVRWTGNLDFFKQMRSHAIRALDWIDGNLQGPITGFLSYGSRSEKGLINQGWKDSGNSIVNDDGSLALPPIALVEAQAYVYGAWLAMADLFRRTGEDDRARKLEQQACDLQKRFHEAFWMDDKQFFALAIQRDRKPARAIASNPGQALFSHIVDDKKAKAVAKRLLSDDMFTGWGIRTLSAGEAAYNPLDYQVGSVWPHDNALIALGLRRYGFTQQVEQVFTGIFEAATRFTLYRLPEVFDGFSRSRFDLPVHYPVACNPQAWAAGALPLLLTTSLGLEPDALNRQLRVHRPHLPAWLPSVTAKGIRVGDARVDLRYQRQNDVTLVAVIGRRGDLAVTVDY